MAGEKGDKGGPDWRALERYDPRRVIPKSIRDGLHSLIITEETETKGPQVRSIKIPGEGFLVEKLPESGDREQRLRMVAKEGQIRGEEREILDTLERDAVTVILRDALGKAVSSVADNMNIYPYDHRTTVEVADMEMNELIEGVESLGVNTPRSREILTELNTIKDWVHGNGGVLLAAGATLQTFHDGLGTMMNAVRVNPRHDLTSGEEHEYFSSLSELKDWKLGEEITQKQDQIFEILRGIAAIGRDKSRNAGESFSKEYLYSAKHVEFINAVFNSDPSTKVQAIDRHFSRDSAVDFVANYFAKVENRDKSLKFVVGRGEVITEKLIKSLRREKNVWVDGVEWPINDKTLKELEWKVGSGDKVFIGKTLEVNHDNFNNFDSFIGSNPKILGLKDVPLTIDNIFAIAQKPEVLDEVKKKLSLMIDLGIWEKLKNTTTDVEREVENFSRRLATTRVDILNRHIIEMARIFLLYDGEGARLGWGFDYELDKDLGAYKRSQASGGTKAATDMATPFYWLLTEAGNGWKAWTHGTLPMDKRSQKQIITHEPGWAPNMDANGKWRVTCLGVSLEFDVPTKFDLSLMDVGKIKVGGEDKKPIDLIHSGSKMSEIPWKKLPNDTPYRWFITMSQLSMMIGLFSIPNKESSERFFGGRMTSSPRMIEVLELFKREELSHRDAQGKDDVKKFMPFIVSLNLAWSNNLLPTSRKPGMYDPRKVRREARMIASVLKDLVPKGDDAFAKEMSDKLLNLSEQNIRLGTEVERKASTDKLRAIIGI